MGICRAFLFRLIGFSFCSLARYNPKEAITAQICPRGEMDIMTAFEAVVGGSNPSEGTANAGGEPRG